MSFPNNRYGLDLLKLDSCMMLVLQISNWKMTLVMFQAVTKCWGRWEPFLLQSAPWHCRLICWEHQRFSGSMTNLMRTYLRCSQLGLLSQWTWGHVKTLNFWTETCNITNGRIKRCMFFFQFSPQDFPRFFLYHFYVSSFFACPQDFASMLRNPYLISLLHFRGSTKRVGSTWKLANEFFGCRVSPMGWYFSHKMCTYTPYITITYAPEKWWLGIPIFRGELEL